MELDPMSKPKNVLLSVITTDVSPSAIGDLLYLPGVSTQSQKEKLLRDAYFLSQT